MGGQGGSDTALVQIAAEVLDVDMDRIIVVSNDLDTVPYDPGAYASSGVYVTGNAVIEAAKDMKKTDAGCRLRTAWGGECL